MTTKTRKTTRKAADQIVMDSQFEAELSGDYEKTEAGHVYGMEDGSTVVVTFSGELVHFPAEDMPLEDEGCFTWLWDAQACIDDGPVSSDGMPFNPAGLWEIN